VKARGHRPLARQRSPGAPSERLRQRGAALVLVLAVALLLGLTALSVTFTVTLDSLAARNAQEAALAEGQAEGAVELGAKAVVGSTASTAPAGSSVPRQELGPWPDAGVSAAVGVVAEAGGAFRLETRAHIGTSTVRRVITVDGSVEGLPVVRARP